MPGLPRFAREHVEYVVVWDGRHDGINRDLLAVYATAEECAEPNTGEAFRPKPRPEQPEPVRAMDKQQRPKELIEAERDAVLACCQQSVCRAVDMQEATGLPMGSVRCAIQALRLRGLIRPDRLDGIDRHGYWRAVR